ncbi:MAG TPA: PrsW family glutamic-type intramembrane protease [Candidatus Eisenbacteria bacterium]|jgi:RsiW-degrading membrane proteinase PrsW (M82 family)
MGAIGLSIGFVPVVLFLAVLMFMDSYKLVRRGAVLRSIGLGCLAALTALLANRLLLDVLHVPAPWVRRALAPIVEETLKALYLVRLIRSERVGFMVDAGIHGFALGTGFALVENVYYAWALGVFQPVLWLIRGVGTAVMHGGTTAIVGVVSKGIADRRQTRALVDFVPGLAIAAAVHALFNQLSNQPLIATAVLLVLMPLLLLWVYERSERATREWLGVGLDSDVEVLELISSGEIRDTRIGRYLESLKQRFPGPVVADLLCLLQVHLELAVRSKGVLIARAAGLEIPMDDDVRANFEELEFLERSVGPTGKMAILPFLRTSSRDLWQLHMLQRQ